MPDHFGDQLAPVPALQAAADATSTLRVGALVWDNDYKHPVVLAKELATIDLLSEGRLEIGLGAGWMVSDYEQSGIPYDRAGVRVDRFVEGLSILKAAFGEGPVNHAGTHYTVSGYNGLPKPVQKPYPPILIGGGGRRVLGIAAREADIVGINGTMESGVIDPAVLRSMTAGSVEEKAQIVLDAAGPRLADIEMNVRAFLVSVTDDRKAGMERIAQAVGFTTDEIAESPFALIGPPSKLAEDLLARRERWGFSYVIVGAADVEAFAPVIALLHGR
jgi:probable F420-dependent oxidoreductase